MVENTENQTKSKYLIAIVVGCVFVVAGFFGVILYAIPTALEASASGSWPTTAGVITRSEVNEYRSSGKVTYSPTVVYDYQFAGESLTSDQIGFGGDWAMEKDDVERLLASTYPIGGEVTVFFNPDNPKQAALEAGMTWTSLLPLGLGCAFMVIGGLVAAQNRKLYRAAAAVA